MTPTSSFRVADDSFMTRQLDKEPPLGSRTGFKPKACKL